MEYYLKNSIHNQIEIMNLKYGILLRCFISRCSLVRNQTQAHEVSMSSAVGRSYPIRSHSRDFPPKSPLVVGKEVHYFQGMTGSRNILLILLNAISCRKMRNLTVNKIRMSRVVISISVVIGLVHCNKP